MVGSGDDPNPNSGVRKGDAARAERLRMALRENLKRRKAQARARAKPHEANSDESKPDGADPAHDSAGFVPDKPSG